MPSSPPSQEHSVSAFVVPVEVMPRHVHVSPRHYVALFGVPAEMDETARTLSQRGQFVSNRTVEVIGSTGSLVTMRVLGPCRQDTQVELSLTDAAAIGLAPPVRLSGDMARSPGCVLRGPAGEVRLRRGVIVPAPHVHMNERDARRMGVGQGQRVRAVLADMRASVPVLAFVRVHPTFRLALHLTTDHAAEAWATTGDQAQIFVSKMPSTTRLK
ncbi:propanediol utilization protein [Candidatus Uhrbacteria bacterium]|nr:propanediol utilization protein [Candidatus Uhrbacteria bacterium]